MSLVSNQALAANVKKEIDKLAGGYKTWIDWRIRTRAEDAPNEGSNAQKMRLTGLCLSSVLALEALALAWLAPEFFRHEVLDRWVIGMFVPVSLVTFSSVWVYRLVRGSTKKSMWATITLPIGIGFWTSLSIVLVQ